MTGDSRKPRPLNELVRVVVEFRRSNKRAAVVSGILGFASILAASLVSTRDSASGFVGLSILFFVFTGASLIVSLVNLPASFTLTERVILLLWDLQQSLLRYRQELGAPTRRRMVAQRSRWRLRRLSVQLTGLGLTLEQRKRYDFFIHDRKEFVQRLKGILFRVNFFLQRSEPIPERATEEIAGLIQDLETSESKLTTPLENRLDSLTVVFGGPSDERLDENLSLFRAIDLKTIIQSGWFSFPQFIRFALTDAVLLAMYWAATSYVGFGIDQNTRFSGGMVLLAGLVGSQILVSRK